ncbi:hypothetical protein [Pseudomonas citronellolis]|uniref:hypothetical protein n=1 Tax=Pseudomonas citronellolis TaxID=53408 RepID=UPI0023E44320|nr:hypothetical protein [Pseudomonas citronellolis]MDF3934756.1 hypothetical protein [Pseudomonas citronellolis]
MTIKTATRQKSAPKPAPAVTSRESLEAQVAAFLNSGGEIQQVAKGVTGQPNGTASRHISLGKK